MPLVDLEESEWRRVLDVNLNGTFLVTKAVGRALIEQGEGGRIVNLGSIAGRQGLPTFGAYAVTKAGLVLFTQVLAAEMAPHGINVNCVCPGLTDTYRMEDITRPGPIRDAVFATIPLRRAGRTGGSGRAGRFPLRPGRQLRPRPDHQHRRRPLDDVKSGPSASGPLYLGIRTKISRNCYLHFRNAVLVLPRTCSRCATSAPPPRV